MTDLKIQVYVFVLMLITIFFLSCNTDGNDSSTENISEELVINDPYEPRYDFTLREELVFTLITASGCGFCTLDETKNMVIEIKNRVSDKADSLGVGFLVMGVSADWDVNEGIEHLRGYGNFDEILVGNNWFGTGGIKYIFNEFSGMPMIPQIVITKRVYDANTENDGNTLTGQIRGIESETVIERKIGINHFDQWLSDDVPLPDID